jgi:TolA-binding protein
MHCSYLRLLWAGVISFILISCSSSNFNSILYQAETLRSQKKYEQALSKYNILIKKYPNHEKINKIMVDTAGLYETVFQSSATALQYYQQVAEQREDAKSARLAYNKMAKLYEKKEDWVMANDTYQNILKYFPDDKKSDAISLRIAENYSHLKDFKQAQIELMDWLNQFPDSNLTDKAYMKLGEVHYAERRFRDAYKIFEKIVRLFPNSTLRVEAYYNMAFCLEELSEWSKALEHYKKIRNHYPNKKAIETKIQHLNKRIKKTNRG